jgi:hypothetical protein
MTYVCVVQYFKIPFGHLDAAVPKALLQAIDRRAGSKPFDSVQVPQIMHFPPVS